MKLREIKQFRGKAKSDWNVTRLSLLPASGSEEKLTAPEPGQVCCSCASILSYLVFRALRSSHVVLAGHGDWLMGAGLES